LLGDQLQKEFPKLPRELLDATVKSALADPKIMERAKQFAKERQTDPGRPPQINPEDLEKLAKIIPRGASPPKLPPDVKLPDNWRNQPEPEGQPTPKLPNKPLRPDVNTGKTEPEQKLESPPQADPAQGRQEGNPALTPGEKSVDDSLFRPPEEPTDPRTKSLQAFASVWERNIGPLDQTPEVKRALFDLVSGNNGLDLDLQDDRGNSIWDLLKKGDGDGLSFGDFMNDSGGNWKLPKLDFPSMRLGSWFGGSSSGDSSSSRSWRWGNSPSRPRMNSPSGGSGGLGSFGFGGSWFPVVVLGIVVLGILLWVVVKNLRMPESEIAFAGVGLGPWPVDPRRINSREDVVKAFEYLSVLICGASAKTWTHNTIADALTEIATTHGETAIMLARLYELARYAPLDEPLTHDEIMEARELVCGLAGVSY
jgi:hypothetical protein